MSKVPVRFASVLVLAALALSACSAATPTVASATDVPAVVATATTASMDATATTVSMDATATPAMADATATTAASTDATATPAAGVPAGEPVAITGSTQIAKNAAFDAVVADIAKSAGMTNYDYEALSVPSATTWDAVLAYYSDLATKAGINAQGTVQTAGTNKVGVFYDAKLNTGFVIVYVPGADASTNGTVLSVVGKK